MSNLEFRVLITGGSGLIGSKLAKTLLSHKNVHVIVVSRNEEKIKRAFKAYLNCNKFTFMIKNLSNRGELDDIPIVDLVFHAASPMERSIIENDPLSVVYPNIVGTDEICKYLVKQYEQKGVRGRLMLLSSVSVYGNDNNRRVVVAENDTEYTSPINSKNAVYSQSKRMAEVLALAYHRQYKVDVVIGRISTVYGPTDNIPNTAFYEFVNSAINGQDIVLKNTEYYKRDNIYIDDAIDALIKVAKEGKSGDAYNISSNGELGNYASVAEIARCIAEDVNSYTGKQNISVVTNSVRPVIEKEGIKLDNSKLKRLGWRLNTNLNQGIRNTICYSYTK